MLLTHLQCSQTSLLVIGKYEITLPCLNSLVCRFASQLWWKIGFVKIWYTGFGWLDEIIPIEFASAVRALYSSLEEPFFWWQFKPPTGCLIYRITGATFLQNTSSPTSIIPIPISSGNPMAGGKPLKFGYITYITRDILIEPQLNILVLSPLRKADS